MAMNTSQSLNKPFFLTPVISNIVLCTLLVILSFVFASAAFLPFVILGGLIIVLVSNFFWFRNSYQRIRNVSQILDAIRQHQKPDESMLHRTGILSTQLKDLADHVHERVVPEGEGLQMVALDLEKNELESVIYCMTDGLIIYDMDLEVVLLNPALAEMLIPSNPAATGRLIQNPDDRLLFERCVEREQIKAIHKAMIEEPMLPRCDVIELQHPPQFLKRYSSPLYNRLHKQIGHVIIYHDITQEVQSERVRSEFITNASHELRTPVTSMKLLLETLDGGAKDDPKVRSEFIRNLLKEADRMHLLVNDLLDLSRLESANENLALKDLDIRKAVHDSIQTVRPLAEKKGVAILENIEPELETLLADQLRLGQVLINLVNNAVKFTPTGGEVRVVARRLEQAIEFRIQDTGIGIPQEDLPYIFDRFYRVELNRQRRQNSGGSGLGLTISKQVVELHGGKIRATSDGQGTTFIFTIPQEQQVLV